MDCIWEWRIFKQYLLVGCVSALLGLIYGLLMGCTAPTQQPSPLRATLPAPTLVAGTRNTWTDGTNTWAGNPWCARAGFLLKAGSPAIDKGVNVGLATDIYGSAPDIGACEYKAAITPAVPAKPTLNTVK